MYEIRYNGVRIALETIDAVMDKIIQLHEGFKKISPQMILIDAQNISIELGIGHKEDKMAILFTIRNSDEDSLISFNGKSLGDNVVFDRQYFVPFECNANTLIHNTDALKEIRYILINEQKSDTLKWYSW